jgi:hypothetical protein
MDASEDADADGIQSPRGDRADHWPTGDILLRRSVADFSRRRIITKESQNAKRTR